jgi:hypothetical protein
MRRQFAVSFLLYLFVSGASAQLVIPLVEPRDDPKARQRVRHRAELKPLADEYTQLIQRLLVPRPLPEIDGIFGPVLTAPPRERVLPLFAPEEVILPSQTNEKEPSNRRRDFHALDDVGFVQFYFGPDGVSVQGAVLYFPADPQFVPLKSGDDFAARLRWERDQFDAAKKWLNEHLPTQS